MNATRLGDRPTSIHFFNALCASAEFMQRAALDPSMLYCAYVDEPRLHQRYRVEAFKVSSTQTQTHAQKIKASQDWFSRGLLWFRWQPHYNPKLNGPNPFETLVSYTEEYQDTYYRNPVPEWAFDLENLKT